MPLPAHALSVHGGCNCGAIRYKIKIPSLHERPLHPSSEGSDNEKEVRLPMIALDHCNDCRRATGAVLPLWICSPTAFVTSSLVLRSKSFLEPDASKRKHGAEETRGPWLPAEEVFQPGPISSDSFLTFYESSEGRRRSFCGRCGTNLAYSMFPVLEGWPEMLDVVLGTVDTQDLDGEMLAPERQLWWDCGIDWIRRLASEGAGAIPKHPIYKINEFVE